ncbi:MAG: Lar family restriction alleviation protein [Oscillospiraceae bacterium]|nr:Lar family restriction alleviation protein [Oscillospiraceae bacterium]
MNREIKLKNCPFCGNDAYLAESWEQTKIVQCAVCGCHTVHYANKLDAIEAWNRRVSAPETSEKKSR